MYLEEYTGRGIRVAVVDSGVYAGHPHVGGIAGGVAIHQDGSLDDDVVDRLGHGTAVAAAIHEKAPDAALVAIKVFWRSLDTDIDTLVRGIDESCARGATIVNLSLGTPQARHRACLEAALLRATERGAVVVAAMEDGGMSWFPGSLAGVVPVVLDWECPRERYLVVERSGRSVVVASGYPRDIPGVSRERNLKGISFAVANAAGFAARAAEACAAGGPDARPATVEALLATLRDAAPAERPS